MRHDSAVRIWQVIHGNVACPYQEQNSTRAPDLTSHSSLKITISEHCNRFANVKIKFPTFQAWTEFKDLNIRAKQTNVYMFVHTHDAKPL